MIEIKESGRYETRLLAPLTYEERQGYWELVRRNPEDGMWGKVVASTWYYWPPSVSRRLTVMPTEREKKGFYGSCFPHFDFDPNPWGAVPLSELRGVL